MHLVLEYAKKGNLFVYLKKRSKLSESEIKRLFKQVCEAVAYLHGKRIIHRDLKPENILLDSEKNAKLCDFGWSALKSRVRTTFCGTYEYMAPEIFSYQRYDEKVDIWSLGILLYELLHGYSPFRGNDAVDVYRNILERKISFKADIDPLAKKLIKSILKNKPQDRMSIDSILRHRYLSSKKEYPKAFNIDANNLKLKFKKARKRSLFFENVDSGICPHKTSTNKKNYAKEIEKSTDKTKGRYGKNDKMQAILFNNKKNQSMKSIGDADKKLKRGNSPTVSKKTKSNTSIQRCASPKAHYLDYDSKTRTLSLSTCNNIVSNPLNRYFTPAMHFKNRSNAINSYHLYNLTPVYTNDPLNRLTKTSNVNFVDKKKEMKVKDGLSSTKHTKSVISLVSPSRMTKDPGSIKTIKKFEGLYANKQSFNLNQSSIKKPRYTEKLKMAYSPSKNENFNYTAFKDATNKSVNSFYRRLQQ